MKQIFETGPNEVKSMTTESLRNNFLVESLMTEDSITAIYSSYDRMVLVGTKPKNKTVTLDASDTLKSKYFLERREIGIINVGGAGYITVDGTKYPMETLSCLYIGKGIENVSLSSNDSSQPASYFMLSTPAHMNYPTKLYTKEDAAPMDLGNSDNVNQRILYKYIHNDGIMSCQLVMGLTVLKTGNIWNTMPPHTHDRRSEVYFYFDIAENNVVFHFMGQPIETRHLVVQNHQAIISPPWSIHAGAGTASYAFIWGMGGENKDFSDMDVVKIDQIR